MRRTGFALALPALAILAAALAYIGAFAWNALSPGVRTATAQRYLWRDSAELTGVVIRSEQAVAAGRANVRFTAPEGRRVAAGEVLGVAYDSGLEYFRASLLLRLREELSLREGAVSAQRSAVDIKKSAVELKKSVAALSAALGRGNFAALAGAAARLRAHMLPAPGPEDTELLRWEIASLENAGGDAGILTAPASGFFSTRTDGWETLSPGDPGALTREALLAAMAGTEVPAPPPARLVTGGVWLFAAPIDGADPEQFVPGDTVALRINGQALTAEVCSLSPAEDGAVAVLSFRTGLAGALDLRTVRAEAEFARLEGFLLPEEAVHADEEGTFVYRLAGELVRRETVTVLAELEEGVLAEGSGLREGSTVLLGEDTYADGTLLR